MERGVPGRSPQQRRLRMVANARHARNDPARRYPIYLYVRHDDQHRGTQADRIDPFEEPRGIEPPDPTKRNGAQQRQLRPGVHLYGLHRPMGKYLDVFGQSVAQSLPERHDLLPKHPRPHVALRKLRHAAFDALASDGTGQIHVRQRTYGRSIRNSRIQKRPDDRRSRSPHRRRDRTRTDDQRTETGQSAR